MRCSRLQLVGAVLGAAWVALIEEEGGDQVVEGVRVLEDERLVCQASQTKRSGAGANQ